MKSTFLVSFFLFSLLSAQRTFTHELTLPQKSPRASVSQTIGITTITIDYGSPALRGRKVWGTRLVPYGFSKSFTENDDFPWRAGANMNTTITFSSDVRVSGKELKAGTYGFHIAPQKDQKWILIFSKNATNWGSYFYKKSEDALRIKVKPEESELSENLHYGFDKITENTVNAYMKWEKVKVSFSIELDVHKIVLANIRKELYGAAAWAWMAWHEAAKYCLDNKINYPEALQWVDISIQKTKNWENLSTKAFLLGLSDKVKEGKKLLQEAITRAPDRAKKSLEKQLKRF